MFPHIKNRASPKRFSLSSNHQQIRGESPGGINISLSTGIRGNYPHKLNEKQICLKLCLKRNGAPYSDHALRSPEVLATQKCSISWSNGFTIHQRDCRIFGHPPLSIAGGIVGDILHVFWTCPLLAPFWVEVFRLISSILGIEMQGKPEVALLHLFPAYMPCRHSYLASQILVATKASIAQLWKSDRLPCLQEVINKVHKHYLFETADLTNSSAASSSCSKWSKWEVYRTEQSPFSGYFR